MTAGVIDNKWGKALEQRAEVDSLEALQHQRRVKMKEYAPLAAKFKGGATGSYGKIYEWYRYLGPLEIRKWASPLSQEEQKKK